MKIEMDKQYRTRDGRAVRDEYGEEYSRYEDWEIDEPVWVRDSRDADWTPRYFAGISRTGQPLTWQFGCTSWSSQTNTKTNTKTPTIPWAEARLASEFTPEQEP